MTLTNNASKQFECWLVSGFGTVALLKFWAPPDPPPFASQPEAQDSVVSNHISLHKSKPASSPWQKRSSSHSLSAAQQKSVQK